MNTAAFLIVALFIGLLFSMSFYAMFGDDDE